MGVPFVPLLFPSHLVSHLVPFGSGYILLDAKVSYQMAERFNINLQVDNLTDKRWYSGAFTSQSVFPGYGTRVRLALEYAF